MASSLIPFSDAPVTSGGARLRVALWPIAILILLSFAVYANGYSHAYHLDDAYAITTNPHVRSLRAIASYFVDPATFATLREHVDYRPILQATYALNYSLGGYDVPGWHATQIVFHLVVVLGIYALCLQILALRRDSHERDASTATHEARPEFVALLAAVIVAVHPTSSGVINYLSARSSLLVAAFVLPALVIYLRTTGTPRYARPQYLAALLYGLALFTKVEAVGALGAFWAFDLWQRAREAPDANLPNAVRASFDKRTLVRLAPALAITIAYFVIRAVVMAPFPFAEARHAPDVGASEYFATQLTAWWYYVARWIAPVRLIADHIAYPVYRSWLDPVVLLAATGWIAVVTLLVAAWKRAPYLLCLSVAALALLSPTSSVAPLAEMVNEHRPYLPIAILSLTLMIPVGTRLLTWPRGPMRNALLANATGAILVLAVLTWRRNEVFATPIRYWTDVIEKAPSARAHLNLGVALMEKNDMTAAMREMHRSLELAPYWYYTHINLGIAYQHRGEIDSARAHYDRAVQLDTYSGLALAWRGEFRLSQRDYAAARDDFSTGMRNGWQYRSAKGLATAFAGLGDVTQALDQTGRLLAADRSAALNDIPGISVPFFQNPWLREAGVRFYEALALRIPGQPWIAENIERLRRGAANEASVVLASADSTNETFLMARGLDLLYSRQDAANAAGHFKLVLQRNALHYGANFQLAMALDRAGQPAEARAYWVKVLDMATSYKDAGTVEAARARLAR